MMNEFWGPPVSVYTRAQAIADGVLADLTDKARPYGFKIPLACTEGVWHHIAWSEHIEQNKPHGTGQSTAGRLHDVLSIAAMAARSAAQAGLAEVCFDVLMVPSQGKATNPVPVAMRLSVGGGDAGEPVLTLMLPHED